MFFYSFNLINEDEDDNKFADCAIAANATYLVSNDRHFEVLNQIDFPKVNWVTLADFKTQIKIS